MTRFRPLKASQYQAKDDPVRLIAERGRKPLASALTAAFKHLRTTLPRRQMATLIGAGDYHGAVRQLDMPRFKDALKAPFARIVDIYKASGDRAAARVTRQLRHVRSVRKAPGGVYGFDLYTDDVVQQLADYQAALIEGLDQDAQQTVLDAILSGVRAGDTPEAIVNDIRDVIGLTERQAVAVSNLRTMLEANSSDALSRALLSPGDAGTIRAAIAAGEPLGLDAIDEIVGNYADNSLAYRADMIAQTESVRASNLGLQDAYMQAIDRGVFPADAVRKFWLTALDERVCEICRPIPLDHPEGISMDDAFDTSDGTIDYPPAHPLCRCSIQVVTNLDQLDAGASSEDIMGELA